LCETVAVPRSPLLELLRRAVRHCHASDTTSTPLAEVIHQRADRRPLSRRAFLGTAGAGVAGLAAAGCRTLPVRRRGRDPQVLIVGAGLAGLTAAYRLRAAGVDVRLIDAQTRVGGRCYSLRNHFPDRQVVELGGELVDTPHVAVKALCEEFGIELDDLLGTEDPSLAKAAFHFGSRSYTEPEICAAFQPVIARLRSDLEGLPGDLTYRSPGGLERLDRLTLADWLDQAGVDGWFRALLDVAYTTEYGLEPGEQSALNLLWLIRPACPPFDIFGESDERYHVRGGNDRMVSALAGPIESSFVLGTRLEAVRRRADGQFELDLRRDRTTGTMAAPHLVLALPFTLLREVKLDLDLPLVKQRAIAEMGYGTNAKLMVGFESRPWRTRHRAAGEMFTDAGFQCVWETSRAQQGEAGVLTNFTGGRHGLVVGQGDAREQAYSLVSRLEQVWPGVAAARGGAPEVRFHWPTHEWVKGSYACYTPGQRTAFRGAEGERVGRLHFAGEHCSLQFQGFMEGAIETGEATARALLADLGMASAPLRRSA
jgi:monoamine oxidase